MDKKGERIKVFRAKNPVDCILCSSRACSEMGDDPKNIQNSAGKLVPVRLVCSKCIKTLGITGVPKATKTWEDLRKKIWIRPDTGWDHP